MECETHHFWPYFRVGVRTNRCHDGWPTSLERKTNTWYVFGVLVLWYVFLCFIYTPITRMCSFVWGGNTIMLFFMCTTVFDQVHFTTNLMYRVCTRRFNVEVRLSGRVSPFTDQYRIESNPQWIRSHFGSRHPPLSHSNGVNRNTVGRMFFSLE